MLETTPAEYVAASLDFYVNGSLEETTVRSAVADVTGPPGTLLPWADRHAADFR